jgi:hypothetical protein
MPPTTSTTQSGDGDPPAKRQKKGNSAAPSFQWVTWSQPSLNISLEADMLGREPSDTYKLTTSSVSTFHVLTTFLKTESNYFRAILDRNRNGWLESESRESRVDDRFTDEDVGLMLQGLYTKNLLEEAVEVRGEEASKTNVSSLGSIHV